MIKFQKRGISCRLRRLLHLACREMTLPHTKFYQRRKIKIKHVQEEKNDKDNFKRSNEMTLSNEKGEEKEKVIHHHQTVYIEDKKIFNFCLSPCQKLIYIYFIYFQIKQYKSWLLHHVEWDLYKNVKKSISHMHEKHRYYWI